MFIPYVIDNLEIRLADVLNDLLQRQPVQQADIATAYFSIRGYEQLRHTLPTVRRFRLLLSTSTEEGWGKMVRGGVHETDPTFTSK